MPSPLRLCAANEYCWLGLKPLNAADVEPFVTATTPSRTKSTADCPLPRFGRVFTATVILFVLAEALEMFVGAEMAVYALTALLD